MVFVFNKKPKKRDLVAALISAQIVFLVRCKTEDVDIKKYE